MGNDNEQKTIYLAALLHDIGKFLERAKDSNDLRKSIIKDKIDNDKIKVSGHPAHSAWFIKSWLNTDYRAKPVAIARDHHWGTNDKDPFQIFKILIRISDGLSASERTIFYEEEKLSNETLTADAAYYITKQISIFSRLFEKENFNEKEFKYTEIGTVNLSNDIIKTFDKQRQIADNKKEDRELKRELVTPYTEFVKKVYPELLEKMTNENLHSYLEKYLSRIPAQTPTSKNRFYPDISLFDHSRTTAAINLCLYIQRAKTKENNYGKIISFTDNDIKDYKSTKVPEKKRTKLNKKEYKITPEELAEKHLFTLLQCDFSGIQSFIFDVDSKGAAKALKGRSAYIQVLSDVVVKYLIDEMKLEEANVIYNGGGNFYILMPQCLEETAKKALKYISEVMYKAHKGDLYLAHGFTPLNMKDFADFADKWYNSRRVVVQNKINRWKELGDDKKKIFEPFDTSEKKYETSFYKSFEVLTKQIKNANYVIFRKLKNEEDTKIEIDELESYQTGFSALGYNVCFVDKYEDCKCEGKHVYKLNDTDFGDCTGFKFMVNKLPEESDFSKIAEFAKGDKKLGLLKMDMDNLGEIFKEGLGKEDRSISRVATLSRNIHLFFEGYLNTILDDEDFIHKEKRIIYPVYAGGDDLLFIGPYDKMIDLAQRIHDDFKKFVADNPEVNISGAMVIIDDKFPLKEAARQVEEHLKKAKSKRDKNSITIMGEVLSWVEYEKMIEMKNILFELIETEDEKKRESRSLLQKILNSTKGFESINRDIKGGSIDIQKLWRFKYYLRDMKEKNEEKQKLLIDWYERLFLNQMIDKSKYNPMILPIATKITELLTKSI